MMNILAKETAKKVRAYVKENYPECKFSVTVENGYNINISLMTASYKVCENDDKYVQVFKNSSNGHITSKAEKMFRDILNFTDRYNYDNSILIADYYDVGFYVNLYIGKWNKPFEILKKTY